MLSFSLRQTHFLLMFLSHTILLCRANEGSDSQCPLLSPFISSPTEVLEEKSNTSLLTSRTHLQAARTPLSTVRQQDIQLHAPEVTFILLQHPTE